VRREEGEAAGVASERSVAYACLKRNAVALSRLLDGARVSVCTDAMSMSM